MTKSGCRAAGSDEGAGAPIGEPKPIAWARESARGIDVCYLQEEPPRCRPWPRRADSTEPDQEWIPLYARPDPLRAEARAVAAELRKWALELEGSAAGIAVSRAVDRLEAAAGGAGT
jgi:hypothetical protein